MEQARWGIGRENDFLDSNDGSTGRGILVKTKGECGIRTPHPPPPPFQTLFNRCTNKYQESNEICSLVLTYDDKQKIILIEFV